MGTRDFWSAQATEKDQRPDEGQDERQREHLREQVKRLTRALHEPATPEEAHQTAIDMCDTLEHILVHGLCGKSGKQYGMVSATSSWDWLVSALTRGAVASHQAILFKIEHTENVHTSDGKGRAWLRLVYSRRALASHFQVLREAPDLTTTWYTGGAYMAQAALTQELVTLLEVVDLLPPCALAYDIDELDCAREISFSSVEDAPAPRKRRRRRKNDSKPSQKHLEEKEEPLVDQEDTEGSPENTVEASPSPPVERWNEPSAPSFETTSPPDSPSEEESSTELTPCEKDEEEAMSKDHSEQGLPPLEDSEDDPVPNSPERQERTVTDRQSDDEGIPSEDSYSPPVRLENQDLTPPSTLELSDPIEETEASSFVPQETAACPIEAASAEEEIQPAKSSPEAHAPTPTEPSPVPTKQLRQEEEDIAAVLKMLEDTSFVDSHVPDANTQQFLATWKSQHAPPSPSPSPTPPSILKPRGPPLNLEGVIRVAGDRRDYFSVAIEADPTPLATPMFQAQPGTPIQVQSPQSEDHLHALQHSLRFARGRNTALTTPGRQAQFIRLPDSSDLALDLGRSSTRGRMIIYLQSQERPEEAARSCGACGQDLPSSGGRYCHLFCSYYCKLCHLNQQAPIPARILQSWDWKPVSVCQAAFDLCQAIESVPLFDLHLLAPSLFRRVDVLKQVRTLRQQVGYMREFVSVCQKHSLRLGLVRPSRQHLLLDTHVYSLEDLKEVESGQLVRFFQETAATLLGHIRECESCLAKGFICEFCQDSKPIYPFDMKNVVACRGCRAFFHRRCYRAPACPKCHRLESRSPALPRRIKPS